MSEAEETTSRIHLLVGLPGSGKTTFATNLAERERAIRLTPDDWHFHLFGNDVTDPDHDCRHSVVEEIMWDLAQELIMHRVDVVLDYGFWSIKEREQVARRVIDMGASPLWYYMKVSADVLRTRVITRNQDPSYPMKIPMDMMEQWVRLFQPPTMNEALLGPLEILEVS